MDHNVTVDYGSRNATLYQGWVSQPNGRGSIDILWSCAFTIFLSSWSVLCLNLPAEDERWWTRARRKFYWMLLTIMGPEIVFQLALGEWLLARKWMKKFKESGFSNWTMTHSFYANMGGFVLETPDHGRFPVNAAQLHHLLMKGHIQYPTIGKHTILDKNKAEAVVRCLTLGQIVWFLVSCMARLHQRIALTTIELSTLAFTSSAVGSFYCWYHKPMDVESPDVLELKVTIESIQREHLGVRDDSWHWTPLDFVDRGPEWPWNIYWQCGMRLLRRVTRFLRIQWIVLTPKRRPVERFSDDYWPEPTFRSLPALFIFHTGYAAILVAGWHLELPTYTELILWRVATVIQLGTIGSACLTMPIIMQDAPNSLKRLSSVMRNSHDKMAERGKRPDILVTRKWYSRDSIVEDVLSRVESTRSILNDDPNWRVSVRLLIVYQVTWAIYFVSRLYIVAEDIASMRALPVTAFDTVDWSEYFPHI